MTQNEQEIAVAIIGAERLDTLINKVVRLESDFHNSSRGSYRNECAAMMNGYMEALVDAYGHTVATMVRKAADDRLRQRRENAKRAASAAAL